MLLRVYSSGGNVSFSEQELCLDVLGQVTAWVQHWLDRCELRTVECTTQARNVSRVIVLRGSQQLRKNNYQDHRIIEKNKRNSSLISEFTLGECSVNKTTTDLFHHSASGKHVKLLVISSVISYLFFCTSHSSRRIPHFFSPSIASHVTSRLLSYRSSVYHTSHLSPDPDDTKPPSGARSGAL